MVTNGTLHCSTSFPSNQVINFQYPFPKGPQDTHLSLTFKKNNTVLALLILMHIQHQV